jgi:hypothetical protein
VSRLDSFIRRLSAQRDLLDHAAALIAGRPGHVLELGLGNGRTYDHLRERLGAREIFVFERQLAAHPDCTPDAGHLFLGDFRASLPEALARLGAGAALAHCDIGSGDREATTALARWLGPALRPLMAPGGLILSDQPLAMADAAALPLPAGIAAGRYYFYAIRLR